MRDKIDDKKKAEGVAAAPEAGGDEEPEPVPDDLQTEEDVETGEESSKLPEVITKDTGYEGAVVTFVTAGFDKHRFDSAILHATIRNISQEKFATIQELVNKHKKSRSIPPGELKSIKSEISDKHLFILLERMVGFSKLGHIDPNDKTLTVQKMFESVAKNPLADQLDGINAKIISSLKDGNILDAIKGIATKSSEDVQGKASEIVQRLDDVMGIDTTELGVPGSEEYKVEKEIYTKLKIQLLVIPTPFNQDPEYVISEIVKTNEAYKKHPKAVALGKKFFSEVKKRTPDTLEKAVKKFEIVKDGKPNYLRNGVNEDKLLFSSACELALLEAAMDNENDQANDLLILGVLLRAFRDGDKNKDDYVAILSDELLMDVPSINIPGLKTLKPYFKKAVETAGSYLLRDLIRKLRKGRYYATDHPTAKSHEEMAESFKNQNIGFSALKEIGGTSLELTSDALAAIVLTLNLEDNIASCETGEEFLDLIRVNGGDVVLHKDRNGAPWILIKAGYEVFLARPTAILWETTKALWAGEGQNALAIWIGGSSFFGTAGALRGFIRGAPAADGSGRTVYKLYTRLKNTLWGGVRGLGYPYKAPLMAKNAVIGTVKGLARGIEGVSSMAHAPFRGGRRAVNWTADVLKRRWGQNIENMVDTGRMLDHHFRLAEVGGGLPKASDIGARAKRTLRTAGDLIKRPGTTLRKMTAGDWHWHMAKKFAELYATQYNDFFELVETKGFKLGSINTDDGVKAVNKAHGRLTTFLDLVQKDPKVLEKIRNLYKKGLNEDELLKELRAILADTDLDKIETKFLAKRLKSEKATEKLIEQIDLARKRHEVLKPVKAKAGKGTPKPKAGKAAPKPKPKPKAPKAPKAPTTKVKDLGGGRFRYGGEEFTLTNKEIHNRRKQMQRKSGGGKSRKGRKGARGGQVSRQRAVRSLLDQRLRALAPAKQTPVAAKPAGGPSKTPKIPGAADDVTPGRLRRMKQNVLGETLQSVDSPEKALEKFTSDLEGVRKKVAKQQGIIDDIADARQAGTLGDVEKAQRQLDKARQIITNGTEAETRLLLTIDEVRKVKKAGDALADAKKAGSTVAKIARLNREMRAATLLAEKAMATSNKAMTSMSRLGKIGKVAKMGWRIGGTTLAAGGFVFSGYEAISSFGEAWSTDVEGRKAVKYSESAMWAVNAAADGAAFAVMLGAAETGAVGFASAAAFPLAPITYAGSTVAETYYERTKTDYEWAQEVGHSPYKALHHFYTSMNSCSLGEAWITGAHIDSPDELVKEQKDTMNKIYRGLIAIQTDHKLLGYIRKTPPSTEKDREVERRIAAAYTINHEFYFRNIELTGIQSYSSALKFIQDAQTFDTIMKLRDEAKKSGVKFVITGNDKRYPFSLHKDRYDIIGGIENPKGRSNFNPTWVVEAYKETLIRNFDKDRIIKGNLDRMDTAYLMRLFWQTRLALEDDPNIIEHEGLRENFTRQMTDIAGYLQAARGVNFAFVSWAPYREPRMDLETIFKHLGGIKDCENKAYLDFEKKNYKMTPALNALYKLGEYFGYTGPPTEEGLKDFFHEGGEDYRGIYWSKDEKQWMLNERGMEYDDEMGSHLTTAMMEKVIARMQEQPDNILKHRSDTVFLDAKDYTNEVKNMAKILAGGLAVGNERGYKRSKLEPKKKKKVPLEHLKHFDPKKIDYKQSKEALMGDYKEVIEYTKKETEWSQLEYKIKDEKSITLSRGDGSATVELTRSGASWNMGGYKGGLSLIQAVALGNLKNWAEQWLKSNKETGGSTRPFEIDGDVIDFDESGTPFDTTFMKGWVGFYSNIGVSKAKAVNTLNNWFEKDGPKG